MQKLKESVGGQAGVFVLQEILYTDPATTKRIRDIKKWLPELQNVREASGCNEYQWRSFNMGRHSSSNVGAPGWSGKNSMLCSRAMILRFYSQYLLSS